MKNTFKLLLGMSVMVLALGVTVVGCAMLQKVLEGDTFPSDFIGTWKRAEYESTLTFSSKSVLFTFQNYEWELKSVSGDAYTVNSPAGTYTMTMRITDGNLVISGDSGNGEISWNGTWIKQ